MTPSLKVKSIIEAQLHTSWWPKRKGKRPIESKQSRGKEKTEHNTKVSEEEEQKRQKQEQVLSRSDARHVVVLGQRREVLVQLLDALLVRFGAAFAFEAVVKL
jgi:hypothetical protein